MNRLKLKLKLGTKINFIVISIILLFSVIIGAVVINEVTKGIKEFAVVKAKGDLKLADRYIRNTFQGEWEIKDGKLYRGTTQMNDNFELVDNIGNDTQDTVTIFQGNTRIATNVLIDGKRAVGTTVSPEVEEVVLKNKQNYYGEALVAGNVYQTAYMPILNSNDEVIGILYVGSPQDMIDKTISSFFTVFLIVIAIVIIVATLVVIVFTRRLKKRLSVISKAMDSAGKGDFTVEVVDFSGDELTDLSNGYNSMKENLRTMIYKVLETSELVAASSEQLNAGAEQTSKATEQITEAIQQVSNGAERQTVSVEESAQALEEVAFGANKIAENSSTLAQSSAYTSERAKQGEFYVEDTVKQIDAINSSVNESSEVIQLLDQRSKQIGEITKAITDIADQTNLLALNAAIEAARAGEHGKGFAVVADEVRKLAEQSQQSSSQIAAFITEIQKEMVRSNLSMEKVKHDVQDGLVVVEKTQESFKEIIGSMAKMEGQIHDMSAVSEQMSANVQEVSATVAGITLISKETSTHSQSVAASTEEQLASMEEVSASANELSKMAMNLQELISKFKV